MSKGLSPLHLAAIFNLADAMKALLERPNVDVNVRDSLGRTPLWYAAACWYPACEWLLRAQPGIDATFANHEFVPQRLIICEQPWGQW